MLDSKSDNRFVQFELWKDCRNGCEFCFNRGLEDVDKVESMEYVLSKMGEPAIRRFNELGFIGGEFFDGQLSDVDVERKFYEIANKAISLFKDGTMKKLYVTTSLIYENAADLEKFIWYLRMNGISDRLLLCTSYDTVGRFHSESDKSKWEDNMRFVHDKFPEVGLHTEIIITQDFIERVLDGRFDIKRFETEFHTTIDYLEPNTGSFYDGKEEFDKHVPRFLPRRKSFIEFLKKTCVKDGSIELFKLFSKRIRSDVIYLILNGKHVEIVGRRNGTRTMGMHLKIMPKFGYVDSDIDIYDDVQQLRSVYAR